MIKEIMVNEKMAEEKESIEEIGEDEKPKVLSEQMKNQPKILIIDDEKSLRISLKKIMERAGYYVETAQDLPSAKKCLSNLQFDLILADIVLPKMSGPDLIRHLEQEMNYSGCIIFITGEPNLETALEAIRLGANDYLEKPITRENLIHSVNTVLTRHLNRIQANSGKKIVSVPLEQSAKMLSESGSEKPPLEFKPMVDQIYKSLSDLKNKYRSTFNEDQKKLLNVIAQAITKMKEVLDQPK